MPKTLLTDLSIRSFEPPAKGQITYVDRTLAGFGVRVSQGGTKTFTLLHGKERTLTTIGRVGVISLKDARAEAKRLLAEATLGKKRAIPISFDRGLTLFFKTLDERVKTKALKERTVHDTKRLLNKHFLPRLRTDQLTEITTDKISKITTKLHSTPSEANHAFAAIRLFFRWAKRRKYVEHSPCDGMEVPAKLPSRERVLSDRELAKVWRGADDTPFGAIVRLCILTGQRRGEVGALRGEYIDRKERTITLPPELTKNKRRHTFPYGDMTQAILETLPKKGNLFPAEGKPEHSFSGWSKCKRRLDKKLEEVDPWTIHDLRRTFATNLAALSAPVHVTEKLLNHVSGTTSGIVAVYQRHTYLAEMRVAVAAWEARLGELLAADPDAQAEGA